ncbi:TonB-dependent hemoglobin/transferrin/lactoferrin family receptor [Moraxella bovis]|uniref:TonB-dependent hemoglobin/transferrin/lactoferrin family receptor n=1 Tax=Moraxella bovis TaxID=476 RepID=UPI0022277490|nr:TonB-dependent hemoglobin/transferrin/lactoferrin family receptor [Moraxella bovis]UZA15709.1 TonB-dependent hemoglobin/transferrin/lactoferrin family receptor [Moraxella bovis]
MHQYNLPKKSLLALLITTTMMCHTIQAHADDSLEPKVHLGHETITISRTPQEEVGETIVTRRELNEQMAQNSQDLVRYNTEVDVAEVGRYGNKGFAIRGVDGNRVAMNIDGVALPEVEVNEIFSPYGYQYEGRFNPDLEMMGNVRIATGSDSLLSGSGAVGGSVSYMTKEPVSMVKNGNLGGYAKVGYTTKNEELLTAVGLAGVYDKAEFLLNYAHREGHELKNHDMKRHDKNKLNPIYEFSLDEMPNGTTSLVHPDALAYEQDSVLAKFYYHINDNHRVGLHGMYQEKTNHMNTQSKHTYGSRNGSSTRFAHDKEELKNYGVNYQYLPESSRWLSKLNLDYTKSEVLGLADTWEYYLGFGRSRIDNPELSYREYRPITNDTAQLTLRLDSLSFDWGRLGAHQFYLIGSHAKQDYTSTAHYLNYVDNKFDVDGSFVNFAFPDAKKDIYHLALGDNIYFNDRFKAAVGVRYDNLRYRPYLQGDKVGSRVTSLTEDAKAYGTCVSNNAQSVFCDAYRAGTHNKESKFDHITWNAMLDYQLIEGRLTARYKVGTGFLAPTVSQIYSNFTINANEQVPNYNLTPETSLTHELELEFKPKNELTLTLGGYITKYEDFIHTKYWNSNRNDRVLGCSNHTCLQSNNLDGAEIKGLKFGMKADFSAWSKLDGNLDLTADYHFSKDKALVMTDFNGVKEVNTLAAVPGMFMLGLNYYSPNNDWEIHGKVRYTQAKKSSDAKYLDTRLKYKEDKVYCNSTFYAGFCSYGGFYDYDSAVGDYYKIDRVADGYTEEVKIYDVVNRSKSTLLFDVYGSKKFGKDKNWILNAGIYNITNEKYIPWETLRQFATTSVNSLVDSEGHGFNRYTAPGRNYALSLTYEF